MIKLKGVRMRQGTMVLLLTAVWGVAGCVDSQKHNAQPVAQFLPNGQSAPADAQKGTCWQKNITPAIIDTVTTQERETPSSPAAPTRAQPQTKSQSQTPTGAASKYQTKTSHDMVRIRRETWVETLCPAQMDKSFVTALQRALKEQQLYQGAVNGRLTQATRTAIRALQQKDGIYSDVLSLRNAQALRLLPTRKE